MSQEKTENTQVLQMEDQNKRQEKLFIGCEDLAWTWQRNAALSVYVSLVPEGRGKQEDCWKFELSEYMVLF